MLLALHGIPFTKILSIVVGDDPVFFTCNVTSVALVAYAATISIFSNLVNTPTSPVAQKATAMAITMAIATRITVAITGLMPAFPLFISKIYFGLNKRVHRKFTFLQIKCVCNFGHFVD